MLTFAQPLFLWALAGLAVPVFLHLVNRRPALLWPFPSIRFLKTSPLPRTGRRRLSDPLLLLLRLMVYAMLILMFAGPRWVPQIEESGSTERRMLIFDLSASMSGWGAFEEAKTAALEKLDIYRNQPVGLLAFADTILIESPPTLDHQEIRRMIDSMQPTIFPALPETALARAQAMLGESGGGMDIWSDFQRSAWEQVSWPQINRGQLQLHPVGRFRQNNRVVLNAQSYPRQDGQLEVLIYVRNDHSEPVDFQIQLNADGRTISQPVSLGAWELSPVVMRIDVPQIPHGILTLADDAYNSDNTYHVYLGAPPPVRVLAVVPLSREAMAMEELYFIRTALETFIGTENIRYQMDALSGNMLSAESLRQFDAVIIGSEALLTDNVSVSLLDNYIESGGVVLLSMGQGASAVIQALRETSSWRLRYEGTTGRHLANFHRDAIAPLPASSRLNTVFAGDAAKDLYLTDLYSYNQISGMQPETILMRSEGGFPLLLETVHGSGRWILSTFSFHSRTSDLPLRNAFLPLLKEVLRIAAPAEGGLMRLDASSRGAEWQRTPGFAFETERPALVNVARSESDPESIADDLMATFTSMDTDQETADTAEAEQGIPLWHWLALLAGLFFAVESLLCGWFDRRSATMPESLQTDSGKTL